MSQRDHPHTIGKMLLENSKLGSEPSLTCAAKPKDSDQAHSVVDQITAHLFQLDISAK